MPTAAARPVVDDAGKGLIGISAAYGPGTGKVICLFAGAVQVSARLA